MNRSLIYGIAVVCLLAVGGPAAQQTQQPPGAEAQQPTFRGRTDLVRVFVTVMDRDGRLVTDLARDTFEVRDEGKPQPITTFDNSPKPIRLIVMLDVSGSMYGNLPLLRAATEQLMGRLRPEDAARVGTFGHDVEISPVFTRDTDRLLRSMPDQIAPDAPTPLWRAIDEAMNRFHGNGEDSESRDSRDSRRRRFYGEDDKRGGDSGDNRDRDGRSRDRDTQASRDTRDNGEVKNTGDERPVILVLTDGKDSGPIDFRKRYVSQMDVIERARQEGVMIYAVGMRSRMSPSHQGPPGIGPGGLQAMMTRDLPDPGLAKVAEETGGGYTEIKFGEDLGAAFARVADELHSQYLLGYAPPKRDGKVHSIDVRVSQRGLQPRARKNYVAAKD